MMRLTAEHRVSMLIWASTAAVLGVLVFLFDPAGTGLFPPCPFRFATGLYCPGCGSLRATHQLLHGNVLRAASLNPLMVLSVPVLAAFCLRPSWSYRRWVPPTAFVLLVTYGLLRNLNYWPFVLLAPH